MSLVTIREYANHIEAHGVKAWLEAHGIFVVLLDTQISTLYGNLHSLPVRLQVMEKDADAALALVDGAPNVHPTFYDEGSLPA